MDGLPTMQVFNDFLGRQQHKELLSYQTIIKNTCTVGRPSIQGTPYEL